MRGPCGWRVWTAATRHPDGLVVPAQAGTQTLPLRRHFAEKQCTAKAGPRPAPGRRVNEVLRPAEVTCRDLRDAQPRNRTDELGIEPGDLREMPPALHVFLVA